MSHGTKLWTLRLLSIPVLLLFPVISAAMTSAVAERFWNNEFPMFELVVIVPLSFLIALGLSTVTVFASRNAILRPRFVLLAAVFGLEILVPAALVLYLLPSRARDREDVRFQTVEAPTIDVTGAWNGSWTDPLQNVTEGITLQLEQQGNTVSGSIVDAGGTRWQIEEGVVSGDRINLFYDREYAFRSRGATLVARLQEAQLKGEYYGHDPAKAGWSSKGTWQAVAAEQ